MKKSTLLLVSLCIIFACEQEQQNTTAEKEAIVRNELQTTATPSKYLSQQELENFLETATPIEPISKTSTPFDTLVFDKVIAYDFDGIKRPYSSVVNGEKGRLTSVILDQRALNTTQVNFLLDFLTDPKTYGEITAACFDPHLGFVFYEGNTRKYVVDICLNCNYLVATTEIPATVYNKQLFDDGGSYGLRGFSRSGRGKVIEISKQLGLDYAKMEEAFVLFDMEE